MIQNHPLISVIVLNYNGLKFIKKCFPSIINLDYKNLEIIFIDNHSDNKEYLKTRKYINSFRNKRKIKFIRLDKNYGYSRGKNEGAKHTNGQYLLFLDNDICLEKNSLDKLLSFYETNQKCGMICPVVIDAQSQKVYYIGRKLTYFGIDFVHTEIDYEKIKKITFKTIGHPPGGIFLIKTSLWNKLGGFDESNFWYLDDFDLGARCWVQGYKNYCIISAKAIHYGERWYNLDDNVWIKRYYNFCRGVLIMMLKNYQKRTLLISVPLFLTLSFFKGIKHSILRKKIKIFFTYFKSIFSMFNKKLIDHIINERKRIQLNRKINDSIFLSF